MPNYKYTAKNLSNRTVRGVMTASDPNDLFRILSGQGLVLLDSSEIQEARYTKKLKPREISEFSRQIADMVDAGIPVIRIIGIMKERDINPKQKEVYEILHKNVSGGLTLSESLRRCGSVFPELFINMYASGEESGQLESTARKMAVHYEKEFKLNAKVKQAMTYPAILSVLIVVVVLFLFTLVLPAFFQIFEGMELPVITQGVMAISHFVTTNWYYIILAALIAVAAWSYLLKIPKFRWGFDLLKLRLPKVNKLLKIIYTARFARTLSSLYSSGLNLVTCLNICSTIVGNKYIEKQFGPVIKDIRDGEPLSSSIAKINGFDTKLSSTIYIGEESGRLSSMMDTIAESFDYEAEVATTKMVALLEPIMIVVMAAIIGTIMLAIMLPLMSINQSIR